MWEYKLYCLLDEAANTTRKGFVGLPNPCPMVNKPNVWRIAETPTSVSWYNSRRKLASQKMFRGLKTNNLHYLFQTWHKEDDSFYLFQFISFHLNTVQCTKTPSAYSPSYSNEMKPRQKTKWILQCWISFQFIHHELVKFKSVQIVI